jgi:hypothetical protein
VTAARDSVKTLTQWKSVPPLIATGTSDSNIILCVGLRYGVVSIQTSQRPRVGWFTNN